MNSSAKSNMYSVARDQAIEHYASHVGTLTNPCTYQFCVVSYEKPSAAVTQALQNSALSLGYDKNGYFSVSILPGENDVARALAPADLFCLIEGIDPFAVVIAESEAIPLVQEAYRRADEPIVPDKPHDSATSEAASGSAAGGATSSAPSSVPGDMSGSASSSARSHAPSGSACMPNEAFPLPRDSYLRLLGRDTVVFASFEAMLANPAAKQRAWALLKKLKR